MQPLRRWVPGPARAAAPAPHANDASRQPEAELPGLGLRGADSQARDLAFCAELAAHGGVAVSQDGFRAESELVRLRREGLLDLERSAEPPFAVVRVALTHKALALLPTPGAAPPDPAQARGQRSHGFEVARGMIGAAFKAELSAWRAQGEPGGAGALELRVLTRIARMEAPFQA